MQETVSLDSGCTITTGSIAPVLIPDSTQFQRLWDLHPSKRSELMIHGRRVKVPRWDRAYGKDYPFAKQVAIAHDMPDAMNSYLQWARQEVDSRLNGLFVNWHDGSLGHYHGKHRDSTNGLTKDAPIITISLGEERVFRLRPYPAGNPKRDFVLQSGDYVVIPRITNEQWTHEVPKFTRYKGRRISVTIRAFD